MHVYTFLSTIYMGLNHQEVHRYHADISSEHPESVMQARNRAFMPGCTFILSADGAGAMRV